MNQTMHKGAQLKCGQLKSDSKHFSMFDQKKSGKSFIYLRFSPELGVTLIVETDCLYN